MDPTLRRRRSDGSRSRQLAISKDPARDAPSHDSRDNHRLGKTTLNKNTITFTLYENVELDTPHDDALIVTIDLSRVSFSKVLIDSGCVANLQSHDTFDKISRPDLAINKYAPPLYSFGGGSRVPLLGNVAITVKTHDSEKEIEFSVMHDLSPFDAVLGRPWLHQMKAVPSIYHQCVKFISPTGEKTIYGNQKQCRSCYMAEYRKMFPKGADQPAVRDPSTKDPEKDLACTISLDPQSPEKCVSIGCDLNPKIRDDLVIFLRNNINTFAWSAADMRGIDINVSSHDLNVDPTFKPIKQKRRKLGPERAKAVNDEVDKLLKIGSIREVQLPDWLANPVVVKKKNGK
ncbi:uncharacterized protein LOC108834077 [Raphanus sativus]|uniref:Uncharacterized protein LOC108834077 n=1 Tax=Raphanus sativus TaxID=3726 RepID=A0A6J0LT62_RAPSA|nr:uncharacterized protein LOC108834077 [Raphanus sativus]